MNKMSLLQEVKAIQKEAFENRYTIIKKELLEQIKKSPFNHCYYVGKHVSEHDAKTMIQFFLTDEVEAKYVYVEDDGSYICVTIPH